MFATDILPHSAGLGVSDLKALQIEAGAGLRGGDPFRIPQRVPDHSLRGQ